MRTSNEPTHVWNNGWWTVTYTYTTDGTEVTVRPTSYADGFADGWNACEAAAPQSKPNA